MRFVTQQEADRIVQLREERKTITWLATEFNVCTATIHNILSGKHKPRGSSKSRSYQERPKSRDEYVEPEEEDFLSYPDDVLFKHVRPWDFIG